jgi:hypothetical protein
MFGVFKKLNANDIKITPFEAHKQYSTTDLSSINASTSSISWSPNNKSTFTSGNLKYYQIDKLYYRDYISDRGNRLELDDAPYKKQERRLYQSASVLSLSQKTFGLEVQPTTLEYSGSASGRQFYIKDDGYGNLYDSNIGLENWPSEDNRVLYISPVQGFKYLDLSIDSSTGLNLVNYSSNLNLITQDDSYLRHTITYTSCSIYQSDKFSFIRVANGTGINQSSASIEVDTAPCFNFNNDNFSISFYYSASIFDVSLNVASSIGNFTLITKEGPKKGTKNNPITLSTRNNGSFDIQNILDGPQYPFRIYYKTRFPNSGTGSLFFERYDGNKLSVVSSSFTNLTTGYKHITCLKTGSLLKIYIDGVERASTTDTTREHCQNSSPISIFRRPLDNGAFTEGTLNIANNSLGNLSQIMVWDKALTPSEIINVSQSITGTYPIGNVFYDNGFAVVTHPNYINSFSNLASLKYKNSVLITENEYHCSVNENEFNSTNNLTIRKIPSIYYDQIADFATGSEFKPYVTTIGLYDDDANLLAVGKLGQPVKMSDETDTTFVIRFDV